MNGRGKHKRFRVTATVTFAGATTMAEARRRLASAFDGDKIYFSSFSDEPDAILRGPFKATPFPKRIKRK